MVSTHKSNFGFVQFKASKLQCKWVIIAGVKERGGGRGRVFLVSGSFLVTGPMSFICVWLVGGGG